MAGSTVSATELPSGVDRVLATRALAWLAQREYSREELRSKLMRHRIQRLGRAGGVPGGDESGSPGEPDSAAPDRESQVQRIDAVLDWLEHNRHLSQQRFVESRLHLRSQRFGNARIRQELAQHGVSLSAELEASLRASEFDRARAVWERKFGGTVVRATPSDAARQVRFLAGRGFSGDVIRRVLREAELIVESDPQLQAGPSPHASLGSNSSASGQPGPECTGGRLRLVAGGRKNAATD